MYIGNSFKYAEKQAKANANSTGVPWGIFFDTSGNMRIERVNPTAQYGYVRIVQPKKEK